MEQVSFTVDPIWLTRTLLQRYVEEIIEDNYDKAFVFACYEYLRAVEDQELEEVIEKYMKNNNVEEITFSDWEMEVSGIINVVFETEKFNGLKFEYERKGYGSPSGMGIVDKINKAFYPCGFGGHWNKLMDVVTDKHSKYGEPLDRMYTYSDMDEYNGVTREELDKFIMDNFEFVGGTKPMSEYL